MQTGKIFFLFLTLIMAGRSAASEAEPKTPPAAPKSESAQPKTEKKEPPAMPVPALSEGVYARFETTLGDFTVRLYADRTPKTVENFVALAEGKKPHLNQATGRMVNERLYDNRKIFRLIRGFMFQTGSGNDTGMYSPGFTIPDEIFPNLKFTKPGLLAMANTGSPNSGGCQFFVTFAPTPFLDGKYTIFGEVVQGMDTVRKIEAVPVRPSPQGENSLPLQMPVIKKTTILRIGKDGQPLPDKSEPEKETSKEAPKE